MNESKLNLYIDAVREIMMVSLNEMLYPRGDSRAIMARGIICYLVHETDPSLLMPLSRILCCNISNIYQFVELFDARLFQGKRLENFYLREVKRYIEDDKIARLYKKKHDKGHTKRLFGFEYSDEDIKNRRKAAILAFDYVQSL